MGGLRERVRLRTRGEIAAAAMALFVDRGFDRVTVAQVAAAAGVSEKTVYNHFPSKPDLVFDADDDVLGGLLAAVRGRPGGATALDAVRQFLLTTSQLGEHEPLPAQQAFRRLVADSPALQAHQRQMAARYEVELARLLAEETEVASDAPEPFLAAVGLVGALRAGYATAPHSGGRATVTARALDLLESGLRDYARRADHEPADRSDDSPDGLHEARTST